MSPAGPTVPPPWLNASPESSRPGCAAGLLPQGLGLQARSSKFHSEGAHSPASPSWSVKKKKKNSSFLLWHGPVWLLPLQGDTFVLLSSRRNKNKAGL